VLLRLMPWVVRSFNLALIVVMAVLFTDKDSKANVCAIFNDYD